MKSVNYQVTQLENGATIATAAMPHMESVCLGIWAAIGSRYESPAQNGIAHFVEHLLFKGTPTRDALQISREIEGIGASVDAFTTEDHTCFYTRGPAESLPNLADVLLDMFCRSTFDPVEIEREREVILEEIAMYRDNPSQHIEDLLGHAAWPDHPLGRAITGSEDSVRKITRGDLFSFHQTRYTGENVIITASGNLEHDAFVDLVRADLETLDAGEKLTCHKVPTFMRETGPRRIAEMRDIEQSHLCIGFHSCGRHDPERYALKALNVILGENMSSRLFQVLREENGLCYSVYSDILPLEETGLLSIYTGLDLENVPRALELIEDVLREFTDKTVSQEVLERAVNYTIGQSRIALESTADQMMWCAQSLLGYGKVIEPQESFERLRDVTPADVKRVAQHVFKPELTALAYIGAEVPELALDGFLG